MGGEGRGEREGRGRGTGGEGGRSAHEIAYGNSLEGLDKGVVRQILC